MLSKRARGEPRGGKRLRPNGPRPDVDFYPESVCWSELADPADSRYTRSFRPDPEDACAARDFFENHGFVVFRDVLSVAEITTTVDEIWRYLEAEVSGFDHSDPGTWSRLSSATYGLPTLQSIYCRALLSNRQNPLLCAAIATLLGTEDFLVSQDRFCTYRPTQAGPGFPAHPEWKTRGNLHLDVHPWNYLSGATALEELDYQHPVDFITETNSVVCVGGPHIQVPRPVLVALRMLRLGDGLGIWFHVLRRAPARCTRRLTLQHCRLHRSPHQGVLNLIDNLAVDGGTLLIPRFHRAFRGWVAALGSESENLRAGANRGWVVPRTQGGGSFKFPADDPIHAKAHRIPLRAGSYVSAPLRVRAHTIISAPHLELSCHLRSLSRTRMLKPLLCRLHRSFVGTRSWPMDRSPMTAVRGGWHSSSRYSGLLTLQASSAGLVFVLLLY